MESEVYSVKFEVYSREFKGQSSSSSIGSRIITGNCLESFKEGIWNIARHVLKREVIINFNSSDKYCFSEKETPTYEDLVNFVLIRDCVANRTISIDRLTTGMLVSWRHKAGLHLYSHIWSLSISSATIYKEMRKALLDPNGMDRSGAANVDTHFAMVSRLKNEHRFRYATQDINWGIWATIILKSDSAFHDRLVLEPPPYQIIHLFNLLKKVIN
jgi:hypothetical protein